MIFAHTASWVIGSSPHTLEPKTRTLRLAKQGQQHQIQPLRNNTLWWEFPPFGVRFRAVLSSEATQGRVLYEVGQSRAVQEGRGKPAISRITLETITLTRACDTTLEQARLEGFASVEDFLELWVRMHGEKNLETPAWGITFRGMGQ